VRIDRAKRRLYLFAVGCGLVAEVGLALVIFWGGAKQAALLLFVEAVILGLVFGPGPGMAGAVVPILVLFFADRVFTARGGSTLSLFSAVVFVVMLQAFFAGMAGALRQRYAPR
jgi:hypothetical protein